MKLWTCSKCKRRFEHKNQQHSCNLCSIEYHFKDKEKMKPLYNKLKEAINRQVGPYRIEALPCCIHFVKNPVYAFMCVYILRGGIRVSFSSDYKIKSPRITKFAKIFDTYKYLIDVKDQESVDKELLSWIKGVYNKK